jgi:hypothetical protein
MVGLYKKSSALVRCSAGSVAEFVATKIAHFNKSLQISESKISIILHIFNDFAT